MEKDARLRVALAALRERFGDAIEIVDHWDADLLAAGIARRGQRTRLVYVAVLPEQDGLYDVALEVPPGSESALPFEEAGWRRGLVLSEVADVVASHLGLV
jgi:hypothetical protein